METSIVQSGIYGGYIGIVEKTMETTKFQSGIHWGCIGILEIWKLLDGDGGGTAALAALEFLALSFVLGS